LIKTHIFNFLIFFHFVASSKGNIEVIKELLKFNADIDAKDRFGFTPLIWGLFLNYFIKLNYRLIFFIASSKGNIEAIKELLKFNADIDAKDKYGYTALDRG
jgi:ankyrin repeat protein